MFGFFKKGLEYNKLGKAFTNTIENLDKIKIVALQSYDNSYLGPQLMLVTLSFKVDVLEKIEEYEWSSKSTIFIGNMNRYNLGEIQAKIITEIYLIAEELGAVKQVREILTEGETYHKLKQNNR